MLRWLISLILAALAAIGHGHTFAVDFADWQDGPPAGFTLYDNSADTSYIPAADAGLQVVDGALQTMATGPGLAAGYAEVELPAAVTRIGMEFAFTSDGDPRGAVALPLWVEPFQPIRLERVPGAPVHMFLTRTGWAYQVYDAGKLHTLASGPLDLPADQLLTLDVWLDGDTATVHLPDGTTTTVTDPLVAVPARFATFESYVGDAATMNRPRITRVWADT